MATINVAEDVIDRLKRTGHLEIGEHPANGGTLGRDTHACTRASWS